MNIQNIFQGLHGALNLKQLIPLNKCWGKYITKEEYCEMKMALKITGKHLYYDPNNPLNPYIYLNGPVYIPLPSISILKQITEIKLEAIRLNEKTTTFPDYAAMILKQEEFYSELIKNNNWVDVFRFMDKKLLIPRFIEYFKVIPPDEVYEIFVSLYIRSEYGFELFTNSFLKKVFATRFTSVEWKERMKLLKEKVKNKDTFTIYHGHNPNFNAHDSYSWTLSKKTATFFANRFDTKGMISVKEIKFNDVIDYFCARGEEEIIIKTSK